MASDKKIRSRKIRKDGSIIEDKSRRVEKVEIVDSISNKEIRTRKIQKSKIVNNSNFENNNIDNKDSAVTRKKVNARKVRMSLTKAEEKKIDKEMEQDENMSIAVMVFVLLFCFIVGISLGYLLYKIAINGAL